MENTKNTALGFGTAGITSIKTYSESMALLQCAYDLDIKLIDTAPLYGQGYAELIVGKFIKDKRHNIAITTKFGLGVVNSRLLHPAIALPLNYLKKKIKNEDVPKVSKSSEPSKLYDRKITKSQIELCFHQSLKNLKTDYIDNYMFHEGLPHMLDEDALAFLIELKSKGRILNLGLAIDQNHLNVLTAEALIPWDILQYGYTERAEALKFIEKFNNKKHFCHSVIKNLIMNDLDTDDKLQGGRAMAMAAKNINYDHILFSTRNKERLINNVEFFHKYKA